MRILLVDDEQELVSQFQQTLAHQNYDVDAAPDGEVALGLATVRRIIELHGGKVEIESNHGGLDPGEYPSPGIKIAGFFPQ